MIKIVFFIYETFIKLLYKVLIIVLRKYISLLDSIHYSVEELKRVQQSDYPLTNEELNELLDEELSRSVDEMDTDVVDFLINEIDKNYFGNLFE